MGLLSAALGKKPSLLKKAEESANESFQQWARQKGFERCGVFTSKGGLMFLEAANGMDAKSVFSSISTKDFWNGTLRADDWVTLDRESPNFSAFTQFLGAEARARAKAFRMLKISDGDNLAVFFEYSFEPAGFLRAGERFAQELKSVLERRKKSLLAEPDLATANALASLGRARLLLISTKRAFEEALTGIEVSESTIQKALTDVCFEEIFFESKNLFSSPALIYSASADEIKAAAVINPETEDEILKEHISREYEALLGSEAAKKIIILTAGYSADGEEILDYLLRG